MQPVPTSHSPSSEKSPNITDRVRLTIARSCSADEAEVSLETTFEQLLLDSLDRLNVLTNLEQEFHVDVSMEDLQSILTVRAAIDVIEKCLCQEDKYSRQLMNVEQS
jgi:acyl carrier protein